MLLFLLIIVITVNLVNAYLRYKTMVAPPCLFCLGFLICALEAYWWREEWGLGLHFNTFLVLLAGITLFTMTCLHFQKKQKGMRTFKDYSNYKLKAIIPISFLLFSVIYYVLLYRYTLALTLEQDLSTALYVVDHTNKFDDDETIDFPKWLRWMKRIVMSFSYVFVYFSAREMFLKNTFFEKTIYILILLVSMIGPMLDGGRGSSVMALIAFIVISYFFYQNRRKWNTRLNIKMFVTIIVVCVSLGAFWSSLGEMLGRESIKDKGFSPAYYFAFYCGAEIKNLDLYLNESNHPKSMHSIDNEKIGHETFIGFYRKFPSSSRKQMLDLPFRYYHGNTLGNVYTTFYPYIYDFGYIGLVILTFIMAFASQYIYNKARCADIFSEFMSVELIIYSVLAYTLVCGFFSNKFYETFVRTQFFCDLIIWYASAWYLKKQLVKR